MLIKYIWRYPIFLNGGYTIHMSTIESASVLFYKTHESTEGRSTTYDFFGGNPVLEAYQAEIPSADLLMTVDKYTIQVLSQPQIPTKTTTTIDETGPVPLTMEEICQEHLLKALVARRRHPEDFEQRGLVAYEKAVNALKRLAVDPITAGLSDSLLLTIPKDIASNTGEMIAITNILTAWRLRAMAGLDSLEANYSNNMS